MRVVHSPLDLLPPPDSRSLKINTFSTFTPRRCFRFFSMESDVSMSSLNSVNNSQFQVTKVVIQNKQGENLVGLLHSTGSKEIVLLCHGYLSTKETKVIVNLANGLEKEGISAFRFDFSGNGESDGSFSYSGYWREAEDLRSVIEYLNQQNLSVVSIVGHSKGGGSVLLCASKYHDIKSVVNISGRYDLKKGIVERFGPHFMENIEKDGFFDVKDGTGSVRFRVTKDSLMDRLNTNMHEACLKIAEDCSVLTVHGSQDEVVPVDDALEFSKIIPNHKLQIVEGADHCFNSHQSHLCAVVTAFIKTILQVEGVKSQ